MSLTELVGLVRGLMGEVGRLRKENEKLSAALATSRRENQELKDEIRRLKGMPPRPPMKPSGMGDGSSGAGDAERAACAAPSRAPAPRS